MNKLIELLRGCEHDGAFIPVNEVNRLMQEYGKHCADQAWKAKGSMTVYHGDFEDWWSEFQREEETK